MLDWGVSSPQVGGNPLIDADAGVDVFCSKPLQPRLRIPELIQLHIKTIHQ